MEPTPAPWHRTWDLFGLAILALGLRLTYLAMAASHMGFAPFAAFAPDSQFYHYVAEHFVSGHVRGPSVMLMVGPGYGAVLAVLSVVFGQGPLAPILLNILLGTLAPLLVYAIAARLTESRSVALAAGLVSACSLTSVCMSCHILTDQPLFTLYAAAVYCFVRGYQDQSRYWFVAAGLVAAAAAFVRASGQLAVPVFILLAFVLPTRPMYTSRWRLVSHAGLAGLVAGTAIFAWSFRNWVKEDQFVFTTLGVLTVRHCLVAQALAEDNVDKIQEYRTQWGIADGESDLERYRGAYDRARDRVGRAWEEMPGRMLYYYLYNIHVNLRAPNGYVAIQIPSWAALAQKLNAVIWYFWGYTLVGLSILGVILLWLKNRKAAAWILGTHYLGFTAFCGSSFWQGSRLHYTAELAWAILVPYALLQLLVISMELWTRRAGRAAPHTPPVRPELGRRGHPGTPK